MCLQLTTNLWLTSDHNLGCEILKPEVTAPKLDARRLNFSCNFNTDGQNLTPLPSASNHHAQEGVLAPSLAYYLDNGTCFFWCSL